MKFNNVEYAANGTKGGLTFTIAPGAEEGDAVTQVNTATMGRGAAGAAFVGKLVKVESDAKGDVMLHRMVTVRAGAGLTPGYKLLVVDGAGAVTEGAGGRPALVIGIQDGLAVIDLG